MMRKVTFMIDDLEYLYRISNFTRQDFEDLFKGQTSFKAIYTLYGRDKVPDKHIFPDRYELIDIDGNKINIHELNAYQRGSILNDCMDYFSGIKHSNDSDFLYGVINIKEESYCE